MVLFLLSTPVPTVRSDEPRRLDQRKRCQARPGHDWRGDYVLSERPSTCTENQSFYFVASSTLISTALTVGCVALVDYQRQQPRRFVATFESSSCPAVPLAASACSSDQVGRVVSAKLSGATANLAGRRLFAVVVVLGANCTALRSARSVRSAGARRGRCVQAVCASTTRSTTCQRASRTIETRASACRAARRCRRDDLRRLVLRHDIERHCPGACRATEWRRSIALLWCRLSKERRDCKRPESIRRSNLKPQRVFI